MNAKEPDRRRFLKEGAALAGLAVSGGVIQSASGQTRGSQTSGGLSGDSRTYGQRSRFETSTRKRDLTGYDTPLQDSAGIITPNSLFMVESRGYDPPDIAPRQYRLLIHGLVDRSLILNLEELKRLPSVSRIYFIECGGNNNRTAFLEEAETVQQTHGKTSCAEWTGVLLSLLLKEAGVQEGANWLVAEGAEKKKRTMSIPLEKAMDDVLVAYGQNGEPLRPENGYPVRLIFPGWGGAICTKWLRRIKVVDQPYMSFQEAGRYPDLDDKGRLTASALRASSLGLTSVITFPSGGQRLPGPGFYEITGLAWSGGGAVRRVEVSTDGGRTWKDSELQEPVLRFAHARFRFAWNWDGEEAVLQSRCTDERGEIQPSLAERNVSNGLSPDYYRSATPDPLLAMRHHGDRFWAIRYPDAPFSKTNAIQPWKVDRDGSVHNAIFA